MRWQPRKGPAARRTAHRVAGAGAAKAGSAGPTTRGRAVDPLATRSYSRLMRRGSSTWSAVKALGSGKRRSAVAIISAIAAVLGPAPLAGAAVPGENGRIAFDRYTNGSFFADIFTMKPDGSDLTNLTRRSPND